MTSGEQIVVTFWEHFNQAQFDEAGTLLAPDCKIFWPNTREVFRSRNKFLSLNENYPGRWFIDGIHILSRDNLVVSVANV